MFNHQKIKLKRKKLDGKSDMICSKCEHKPEILCSNSGRCSEIEQVLLFFRDNPMFFYFFVQCISPDS
jgi:hypothetical protein